MWTIWSVKGTDFFFRKEVEEFAIKAEKEKDMKRELEEKVIKL